MRERTHDIVSTGGLLAALIIAAVVVNVIAINKRAHDIAAAVIVEAR